MVTRLISSVLNLLVGSNKAEAAATRSSVSKIIALRSTHSLFACLPFATKAVPGVRADGTTADNIPFSRCLLHLTPLKNIEVRVGSSRVEPC